MKTYIYILTDCNRTYLHVGMTNDLNEATDAYKSLSGFFVDSCSKVSRIVYQELLPSEEMALKRFQELSQYTRMQKERLIRKHNPNWINLSFYISNKLSGFSALTLLRPESTALRARVAY
ncbi:putative endonuclease [Parapedobacter indicus]|uniref:Putative endonuclease n=1 Tax=Parapedobacter indicus TaxID=1477437 RepID=A0A1I3R0E1_9SPHI|nr:putative endonuclease [Parapedobacter indicus]SFJ39605.1 putative endonuclease [Parapedobacter indicus]